MARAQFGACVRESTPKNYSAHENARHCVTPVASGGSASDLCLKCFSGERAGAPGLGRKLRPALMPALLH